MHFKLNIFEAPAPQDGFWSSAYYQKKMKSDIKSQIRTNKTAIDEYYIIGSLEEG